MPTVIFTIRGRVQGVGFRWFTTNAARALGLAGWVRNLPDGSVEALAVGEASALAELENALRVGPAGSHVESVSRRESEFVDPPPFPFTQLR